MRGHLFNRTDRILIAALALPFNSLASSYFFRIGNHFVPEIFFIIFAILVGCTNGGVRSLLSDVIKSRIFQVLVFLAILLATIGAFRYDTEVSESYARLRSLICVVFGFSLIANLKRKHGAAATLEFLSIFLASALLFFAIAAALKLQNTEEVKVSTAFFILPILSQVFLLRGKFTYSLIATMAICAVAALSFFRQNYAYAASAVLIFFYYFLSNILRTRRTGSSISVSLNRNAFLTMILLALSMPILTLVSEYIWGIMNSSESRYIQGVKKFHELQAFLNGSGAAGQSEYSRFVGVAYFLQEFVYYLLPNGIINDTYLSTWSVWGGEEYSTFRVALIRDSLIAYSVVTFGWLGVVLMLYSGVCSAIASFRREEKSLRSVRLLAITLFVPVFLLDGAAATQLERSIYLGILLSLAFSPARKVGTAPPHAALKTS